MRVARNIAIILALAAGVAFLPNGGNVADAVMTAITLGFLAAISWAVWGLARSREYLLDSLSEPRRALLYAGTGLIVLMIAGAGNLLRTGPGTVAWLALLASGVAVIWLVLSEARSH
ncbi:MAG: hypothetical protein M9938_07915 [Solirubrobacterales bacterium]|nr:hypothetical protein [Solirubrobacterales bacterium]